jgi:glutamate 5-kinase
VVCPHFSKKTVVCPHFSRLIARKSSQEIENILGYVDEPEIIHRDNLILIS